MNTKYMISNIDEEEVSKEELRIITSRDTSYGFNWQYRNSELTSDSLYAGLSYDNENLVLWVYEYNTKINSKWMIYWWSPK